MRGGFIIPVIAMIAILLGILVLTNQGSGPGVTLAPATTAAATTAPVPTAAPTTAPVATTTAEPGSSGSPAADRLAPPEDFKIVSTANGKHTVSWVWPSGQELDPTFFRVSVQGAPTDFDFTGPGDYEVDVPVSCGNNPNYIHLDAFNTDVEPEANSQAEDLYEVDPGC